MSKAKKVKRTAESLTVELNCDIAGLVIRGMKRKGWKKEDLGKAVGRPPATIEAIVYGNHGNLNLNFVGRLLDALDMHAVLVRVEP